MTLNFHHPNKENPLMIGQRPCSREHTDPKGRTIRRQVNGACWACSCKLPNGLFNFDFGELPMQQYNYRTRYNNDEERRKAQIQRQMLWNKNNPDKFIEAQKRYNAKPERRKRISERQAEYYAQNKEKILAKNRANYWKRKAEQNVITEQHL